MARWTLRRERISGHFWLSQCVRHRRSCKNVPASMWIYGRRRTPRQVLGYLTLLRLTSEALSIAACPATDKVSVYLTIVN